MECPFIYANGKKCKGYISGVEVIKADIELGLDSAGEVIGMNVAPRYHVHLFCSLKGDHVGHKRETPDIMKVWFDELPSNIKDRLCF